MRVYKINVSQGIGDNIMAKSILDQVKHNYDQIFITHHAPIVQKEKNNSPEYWKFLHEIGQLFFSEPPYIYNQGQHGFLDTYGLWLNLKIKPQKPQLKSYLCKGSALNLDQEYIVITTKIRYIDRPSLDKIIPDFWRALNKLSSKYKIVIMGEREVEMCPDYLGHGINQIYGIYDEMIQNINPDSVIDLSIPALGITSPTLSQIQQDCLIMSEAKFVITLGIGGNFCMAMAVANLIGYRMDNEPSTNAILSIPYSDAFVSNNWIIFINKLNEFI
jgi:hypothetical protein